MSPLPSFAPGAALPPSPQPHGHLVLAQGLDVVVVEEGPPGTGPVRYPTLEEGRALADGLHFLGAVEGREAYAAPLAAGAALPAGWARVPARSLFERVDAQAFGVAGRAIAVAEWDVTHRFCGRCGTPTAVSPSERARTCAACRLSFYPRISPAVIVAVEKDGQLLLAQNAAFPGRWHSLLAGFGEPGEALEDTAAREVREEVGIEVGDLRYFGSQPWPFGRSLMVGFWARWKGGELRPDTREIAAAAWFRRDALPPLPPPLSIARKLIDAWAAGAAPWADAARASGGQAG